MTTILPSILFGQGFLDLHELAVARSVCREWRDDLSAVFAYDVKRVIPKLSASSAILDIAIAYAKSIHMRLDGRDSQDLVDAIQDEVLNEAHISHERLAMRIFPALAALESVFSTRHLLMWYAGSMTSDNKRLDAALGQVPNALVVLAEDAPASLVIESIAFMNTLSGHRRDYWVCATMASVLNTHVGDMLFGNAENRGMLKAKMNAIIESNPGNKPLLYAAYMIKHRIV